MNDRDHELERRWRRTLVAMVRNRRRVDLDAGQPRRRRARAARAVYKTCPWQPRELVETGLRQWLRCAGAALRDGQVIGMPSHAVDEAWHGFILCTARYAAFCDAAYGQFLHHHPEGGGGRAMRRRRGAQLGRTIVAWTLVAEPGEQCVLWDLDARVGVEQPWGVPADRVAAVTAELSALQKRLTMAIPLQTQLFWARCRASAGTSLMQLPADQVRAASDRRAS